MKADLHVIELEGVAKRYGAVEAVRDVSFGLPQGARVALVGHNGAGKTTLMKLMLGLIRPSAGSLRVLGEDPAAGVAGVRQRLGWLPENVSFNPALTGREVLRFFARLKGERAAAADELLARVGLAEAARRRVGGYSKGMRQRLGLAQAMLGHPRALLLDEPTTGLDPAVRQGLYEMLATLAGGGTTVLLSSHALEELEGRVERVVILDHGRVVADGNMTELRQLAMLPVRLRLTLAAEAVPDWVDGQARRIGPRLFELSCLQEDKMTLLRRAAGDPRVADLEVLQPTLDELYGHFLRNRAGRGE
ncbi:ABC transporter ATP-binding protein [Roseicella frigidaeris]|uniref:ABC transporter ATP-binding protein n=1 Tax=Roseicella frigidaeris TaxID=2230885 RepID=A0A327M319_9PROT|nr:ABC transporter ATP-binding protein [Roseicella frigidaeris]RAI57129.1 ABC transporter ATP-binding protein [Roseicella frigidaeris]